MDSLVSPVPEQRFSDRVENYVRYRPSYPQAIIGLLRQEAGLTASSSVADIGSGTGISAALFLQQGCTVHAVEPNRKMREAAEHLLAGQASFHSIHGSAQATTLPDRSMDLIVAAQAFHWFNAPETRAEFSRILKPDGRIALIWNERKLDATPFLRDYEQLLLDHATDYGQVRHELVSPEALAQFFIGPHTVHDFPNQQQFDFEGLQGRLLSSSYAPGPGHPQHPPMIASLRSLFDHHQQGGQVIMDYTTRVYLGR